MKLLPFIALSIVLLCVRHAFCLPNLEGDADNEARRENSPRTASQPYSSLWKIKGNQDNIRAIQATMMRSFMNQSVDPCDDFYEYACGNWKLVHPIPEDKAEYTVFTVLTNNIQNELRDVLSQPSVAANRVNQELGAEDKARVFFEACIDEDTSNRRGMDPLLYFIDDLGGWPVLDENWNEETYDFVQLAAKTSQLGHPAIISSTVHRDLENSSRNMLYIQQPDMVLGNRDDYLSPNNAFHLDAYRNLIVTVLRLLDVEPDKAEETAKDIVEFEILLASISKENNKRLDLEESYNQTTIAGLMETYATINWLPYLSAVQEMPLHPNQSIAMLSSHYYSNLTGILKTAEPKTLVNYMVWRIIYPFLENLDENFRAAQQTFNEAMNGQKAMIPRWKGCLNEVNQGISMATGAMFVRRYFDQDSKIETETLLGEIKDAFRETLSKLSWIDDSTKELARKKLNHIKLAVGYPDFIQNTEKLNQFYRDLKVIPGKRFENAVNLAKYTARTTRKTLAKPADKDTWPCAPAVVNAFFEQTNNRIVFPVGILQPPVFHKHFPRALNCGALGVFVSHELTHGFDDFGRDIDATGNYARWWSAGSIKAFRERENCFVEQYGNYSFHGKQLQGDLTKGENIADNGGVRQAFHVYRKWQTLNKEIETMPGLDLSNNQLFFLAFAQSWCNNIRPEAIETRLQTNTHSPGKFRVNVALQNFEEFAEAFQCSMGSPMNPQHKCRLW